jgi:hypothetical protein
MAPKLPAGDRTRIREVAARQMEYASLPVMDERREMWYALNDGRAGARPPVIIEVWTFDDDFMAGAELKCESEYGRAIERGFVRNIRNHELINDDKVMPDSCLVGWHISDTGHGVDVASESAEDAEGRSTGYRFLHPIKNLKEDMHMLKPGVSSVDREATFATRDFLDELFGDIMPVRIGPSHYGPGSLSFHFIQLMGMEAFFMAMHDSPGEVHQLMAFLRDNNLRFLRWAEQEGLLFLNNNNQSSASSFHFTTLLPADDYGGGPARLKDLWGQSDSQETVGISPEMFHEFCFPYYKDVCEPFGLIYFGCCEPADVFWNDLSGLPHLKKISISPWCNEQFMGEALRGTNVVFSRKPDPNFLSVDRTLDEEAWAKHVRVTMDAAREVFMEIIIRDVYTLHGDIANARKAIDIARREIGRHYVAV